MTTNFTKIIKTLCLIFILFCTFSFTDQQAIGPKDNEEWVKEKLANMSLEEKVGQLFMIRAHSDLGPDHIAQVERYIKDYKVGGLCFFQGTPTKQAELTNNYQKLSDTPLLISIDGEWGLGMRFPKTAMSFPKQLMLGAIQDNHLIYEMGEEVAIQLKRIGIHVNFAPVADVNNNPKNPVINDRSFGENPNNVASKSYAYMKGMQDNGIIASAKHFPGHGDTDVDSHEDLPVISHNLARLDSIELMPFKLLLAQGVQSVMVAHLHVPALDPAPNMPSSLSYSTTTGLLRDSFNFDGLIFTDGLEMQGVRKHFPPGEMEAQAFLAGNDILTVPPNLPKAFETIKSYVESGKISKERLDESVRRILEAKARVGLMAKPRILLNNIHNDIHSPKSKALKKKLVSNAITLARDDKNIVPLSVKPGSKIASLSIGANQISPFQRELKKNAKIASFNLPSDFSQKKMDEMIKILGDYQKIIVGIHDMNKYSSRNFGIKNNTLKLLGELNRTNDVIVTVFGSPYALKFFDDFSTVVVGYNEEHMTQEIVAKGILGDSHINGRLPVSAGKTFSYGDGVERRAQLSLGYSLPEQQGILSDTLAKIDRIVEKMIAEKAAPGCQIFIARNGKVVYNKSFGYHTYEKKTKVKDTDLYDLASITKVAAATLAMMKLNEDGKLNIGSSMSEYIMELDTTNKKELKIYDIMAHHAGLAGWIPFYKQTVTDEKYSRPRAEYYRARKETDYRVEVAKNLFLRNDYVDSIWHRIYNSDLRSNNNYRYSDLGFYLIAQAVKNITHKPLDKYLAETFYGPLGLERTTFNPHKKFPLKSIVPSENDSYFRTQRIQGYVHDMGSAMLGGVSGHAGLFSNAYELGVIMQMLLNSGYYGGHQYLKPETIKLFTQRHPRSTRRGIGFDMKELNEKRRLNISEKASDRTFGHTGFTGTYAFVDPDYNLVFVMLSNRTYPSMNNKKYIRGNYREKIHTLVYNAMGVPDVEGRPNN